MAKMKPIKKKTVSIPVSFFLKFVFAPLWIIGVGVLAIMRVPTIFGDWFLPIFWLVTTPLIYSIYGRIKKVEIDQDFLYLSDFRRSFQVPWSAVSAVVENKWLNFRPIWIRFKQPTQFGNEILFIPYYERLTFGGSHPVVEELRGLAGIEQETK
jgi:hypothetical protein